MASRNNTAYRTPVINVYIYLCIILSFTFFLYFPGLNGGFVFDDTISIVENQNIQINNLSAESLWNSSLSGVAGPLKRPIAYLSFALNYYYTGLDPYYFKLTNVIIHLLNGIGVFLFCRILLQASTKILGYKFTDKDIVILSLTISAIWLVHPYNLTSVLYAVQRMNSLSSFFIIYGLYFYLLFRTKYLNTNRGIIGLFTSLAIFTTCAILSKENGALLPYFALLLEIIFFHNKSTATNKDKYIFYIWAIFALFTTIFIIYTIFNHDFILAAYLKRPFTIEERLLTEFRVLIGYIQQILIPSVTHMSLYHDDIILSNSILSPPTTLYSFLFILFLFTISILLIKRYQFFSFGILFFFIGHSIESTFFGLELVFEHRNYLPSLGIIIGTIIPLHSLLKKHFNTHAITTTFIAIIIIISGSLYIRVSTWKDTTTLPIIEAEKKPNSGRAQYDAGVSYTSIAFSQSDANEKEKYLQIAYDYFTKSYKLNINNVDGLFSIINLKSRNPNNDITEYLSKLTERLSNRPFHPNSPNQISGLIDRKLDHTCNISDSDMANILQSALDNKTIHGPNKARVSHDIGKYLFTYEHNYQDAVSLIHQAILIRPNYIVARISLIKILTALNKLELAQDQLAELKSINTLKLKTREINQLEININNRRRKLP